MKNRRAYLALPLVLLLAALLLAGCGLSGKKAEGHTRGYNTDENLAAFRESDLFEMAEGYYGTCKGSHYLAFSVDADSAYPINKSAPPTTPMAPFVAVAVRESKDDGGEPVWSVCGGSGEKIDLEGVKTLAVCAVSRRGADYRGTVSAGFSSYSDSFRGYTEDATILYLDVESGRCVMTSQVKGKDLPNRSSSVPRYTLDDSKLVDQIREDLTLPFELSADGEITGGKLDDALNGYVFPSSVKRIAKLELGERISRLTLPASVEFIAEGAIPKKMSSRENPWGVDAPVVLTVEPGSYAETFAREGGYVYRRAADVEEYVWLAGCECTFFSVNDVYPLHPDGDLADFVTLQRAFGKDPDAPPTCYYVLVVEEDSQAEAYAREHQYPFTYDKTVRFCIDGQEWIVSDKSILVPDGTTAGETLDWALRWQMEYYTKLIVRPDTPAEAALREVGAEYELKSAATTGRGRGKADDADD